MTESAIQAMRAPQCNARAVRRWGMPLMALAAMVAATGASAAPPAYKPPPEPALKRWEARFRPGLYEVREFALDAAGQPIETGARTSQACLEKTALSKMARFPLGAAALWQCQPLNATLETAVLSVAMGCPAAEKDTRPTGAMALVRWVDKQQFETVAQKFVMAPGGEVDRLLLSEGATVTRLGNCK